MHVVLVEPEIPQNAGNVARTCALTRSTLHLVKPLGFSLEDRYLKRAGLDYWDKVEVRVWDRFDDLFAAYPDARYWLATTKAAQRYTDVEYEKGDFLVFGKETRGLSDELLERFRSNLVRIPMVDIGRSLNLSNAVAVVLFEALRQQGFPGLR